MVDMNLGDTQLIVKEAKKRGLLRNQLAYVLATAFWETARTMKPVQEAFWLSDAWRRNNLRYYPWHGRGYVQLTWERNYRFAGERLNLDLTTDPTVVMRPKISAEILVVGSLEGWFTGKKLADYITLNKSNYRGARRIINGTDKAAKIAEIAKQYDAELRQIGYGSEPSVAPVPRPLPEPSPADRVIADADKPLGKSTTFWATVGGFATSAGTAISALDPMVALAVIAVAAALAGYIIWERHRKARDAYKARNMLAFDYSPVKAPSQEALK